MNPIYIQPHWPAPPSIKAYTTTRRGGVSLPPFNELNLGLHVNDRPEHVAFNRKHLHETLYLPSEPVWINQTHSHIAVEALPENRNKEADASFTRQPNQVCVVLTGDCLPVLLCNKQGTQAAAIHAGWRGLANGIIEKTLQSLNVNNQDLLVWLGPAIGQQQYEVGEEVRTIFISQQMAHEKAFIPKTASTWLANLYELARIQLHVLGVTTIYGGDYCTYTQTDQFFSARRDKGKTGRMASLIWIQEE